MATRSPERRQHTDRRRRAHGASDLYQRLEEKRQQIERRRNVRREADRAATEQRANPPKPPPADEQPAAPAVAGDLGNSRK